VLRHLQGKYGFYSLKILMRMSIAQYFSGNKRWRQWRSGVMAQWQWPWYGAITMANNIHYDIQLA
jgi:hypothetical protein